MKTRVTAIQCPKCKQIIYSRAHYDFRWCSCKTVAIDGGFDYTRVLGDVKKVLTKYVPITRQKLYDDWNLREDKYGMIEGKKR